MSLIRVLLADDHIILRDSLKLLLESTKEYTVVAEESDSKGILSAVETTPIDLMVLDVSMGDTDTIGLIQRIKSRHPDMPIVMLSMHEDIQLVRNILATGVSAYVTKDSDFTMLLTAIGKALSGGKYISQKISEGLVFSLNKKNVLPHELLTAKEFHIFTMLGKGTSITQLAENLSLSAKTISSHKARIMQKMALKSNACLVKYYLQLETKPAMGRRASDHPDKGDPV